MIILIICLMLALPLTGSTQEDGAITFQPIYNLTDEIAESVAAESGWFDINAWNDRGMLIRTGNTRECLGNLSYALQTLGELNNAEYAGAAGALSLLPTAGALLGSPTKEMWILYKLMPLAGILGMFLSLGGNVTPSKAGDYDPKTSFDYGGIMPNTPSKVQEGRTTPDTEDNPESFARKVLERANDDAGGSSYGKIWFGIFLQLCFIGVILVAMWYCQRGAVITWWCKVWGWMYFWLFLVTVTSIFDNIVAEPFTKNYTMRVCKAPNNIRISDTASKVIDRPPRSDDGSSRSDYRPSRSALTRIETGINTRNRITIDPFSPSTMSNTCFYVVISVQGVSPLHAIFQIISKGSTVAVYAFGTALFASATLLSISAALMLLSLVLGAGVLGRVTAMWMASEMNRHNKPIIHTVVHSRDDAEKYIERIMEQQGIMIEMKGHIILNGICLLRRSKWTCLATYVGLLAGPYDVVRLAQKYTQMHSMSLRSAKRTPLLFSQSENTPGPEELELGTNNVSHSLHGQHSNLVT